MTEPKPESKVVPVRELPIELGQFLKFGGLVDTGGAAKSVINGGQVTLNGEVETRKGRKLQVGDAVSYAGRTIVVQLAKR